MGGASSAGSVRGPSRSPTPRASDQGGGGSGIGVVDAKLSWQAQIFGIDPETTEADLREQKSSFLDFVVSAVEQYENRHYMAGPCKIDLTPFVALCRWIDFATWSPGAAEQDIPRLTFDKYVRSAKSRKIVSLHKNEFRLHFSVAHDDMMELF